MSRLVRAIEKLHTQPKEVRQRVGVFVAGSVTFIIFLVWLLTLGGTVGEQSSTSSATTTDVAVDIATPLETIGQSFKVLLRGLKEQYLE